MAERKYFSANTVEQAILQAARHYQIRPEELAYEQIEKRHGFVRTRKRVLIVVDPASPRKAPGSVQEERAAAAPPERPAEDSADAARDEWADEVAEPAATEPTEAVSPEPGIAPTFEDPGSREEAEEGEGWDSVAPYADEVGGGEEDEEDEVPAPRHREHRRAEPPAGGFPFATQLEGAKAAIERLFQLAGVNLEAAVSEGEEGVIVIEISGPDQEVLLRDRGRLLLAFQHLMPRTIRGLTGETSAVRLDSDNFHDLRAERLRDLAQRVASEVRKEGRARTLEPMAPDERRIVHMTLADDVGVTTESRGQGLFKRVVVSPVEARRRPRGFDPYRR